MIFIGIDLAWSYKNDTGICIMDDSGRVLRHQAAVLDDRALIDLIISFGPQAVCVGIDAPLVVTNTTGSRPAEGLMMRDRVNGHRLQAFNSNRAYFDRVFGGLRGEIIVQGVKRQIKEARVTDVMAPEPIKMMEIFPTGICAGMFPEEFPIGYKIKGKKRFEATKAGMKRLIERLHAEEAQGTITGATKALDIDLTDLTKKAYKNLEDKADAFLCAYGMYMIWQGLAEQRRYGSQEEGFIVIPVRK